MIADSTGENDFVKAIPTPGFCPPGNNREETPCYSGRTFLSSIPGPCLEKSPLFRTFGAGFFWRGFILEGSFGYETSPGMKVFRFQILA